MAGKGWTVTLAGTGLNLALGVLYAWSVFGKHLTESPDKGGFGWSKTASALPYTIAIGVFALMMIPAGRLQDRFGPRLTATIGAVLTGMGLVVASFASPDSILPAILGFGLMAGTGIGLGYAAATPAAVKWFPAASKGLITGIVVSGFGLAPVYIAPLSRYLLEAYGLSGAFRILGISFALAAGLLCQLIANPPQAANAAKAVSGQGGTWRDMLKTPLFYSMYVQFGCAAMAGLMIIGHLSKIVSVQSGGAISAGFLFVAVLAVFNASGRIAAGIISDRIGRARTVAAVCLGQALVMYVFNSLGSDLEFFAGAAAVGFCYGACLSLFPASTADLWGTANLGLNYGVLFTAWGLGGVCGPLLAGLVADQRGSYSLAYAIAAGLLVAAAGLSLFQDLKMRRKPAISPGV